MDSHIMFDARSTRPKTPVRRPAPQVISAPKPIPAAFREPPAPSPVPFNSPTTGRPQTPDLTAMQTNEPVATSSPVAKLSAHRSRDTMSSPVGKALQQCSRITRSSPARSRDTSSSSRQEFAVPPPREGITPAADLIKPILARSAHNTRIDDVMDTTATSVTSCGTSYSLSTRSGESGKASSSPQTADPADVTLSLQIQHELEKMNASDATKHQAHATRAVVRKTRFALSDLDPCQIDYKPVRTFSRLTFGIC